ncbi:hypothetical protein Hanom_Chr07g00604091 [Helianthus anomalus]
MRSVTISSSNGLIDFMKIKVAARHILTGLCFILFCFLLSCCRLCLFLLLWLPLKVSTSAHL